jgi:EEF1A lysine methyltransferase 4
MTTAQYHSVQYWDSRYSSDPETLEWHQLNYGSLKAYILEFFTSKQATVLHLGNGNSTIALDMQQDGYIGTQICLDASTVVTEQMNKRQGIPSTVSFEIGDCCNLGGLQDFEYGFEKALLDSILTGENAVQRALKYLDEVSKKVKSVFLIISHAGPQHRMHLLDRPEYGWKVETKEIPRPQLSLQVKTDPMDFYYLYVLRK